MDLLKLEEFLRRRLDHTPPLQTDSILKNVRNSVPDLARLELCVP